MSTPKPVYSRPNDDEPAPAPKKRSRRRKRKNATTKTNSITNRYPVRGDAVVERHPTTIGDHHKRNRRTHHREKRRARELRAENELLHRRLAAIYDALTLD